MLLCRYIGLEEEVGKYGEKLNDVINKSTRIQATTSLNTSRDIEMLKAKYDHVLELIHKRIDEMKAKVSDDVISLKLQ